MPDVQVFVLGHVKLWLSLQPAPRLTQSPAHATPTSNPDDHSPCSISTPTRNAQNQSPACSRPSVSHHVQSQGPTCCNSKRTFFSKLCPSSFHFGVPPAPGQKHLYPCCIDGFGSCRGTVLCNHWGPNFNNWLYDCCIDSFSICYGTVFCKPWWPKPHHHPQTSQLLKRQLQRMSWSCTVQCNAGPSRSCSQYINSPVSSRK